MCIVCVCLHSRTAGVPQSHATQAGRQAGIKSSQYTKRSSNNNNCVYLAQAILTHTHTTMHTHTDTHMPTQAQQKTYAVAIEKSLAKRQEERTPFWEPDSLSC